MKSMGECYGSSTRHVNTDDFMPLQGEVVSIYPCSSDNTFASLHKRNHWGDAMVVPSGMSLLMVSCPCGENSYLFKPVPVILLLYTFTKEKDSTSHNLLTALAVIFNRATAMAQNSCMTILSMETHGLGAVPKYCFRQNSVSTPVQIGSVPGFTWVFNPAHVLWADNCKLGNPACRCCDGSQWMKVATRFLVTMLLWSHLVRCSAFQPGNSMLGDVSANCYITSFCLAFPYNTKKSLVQGCFVCKPLDF
jgi:hypothetical protein